MALTTTAADLAAFAEVSYTPGTIKSLALQDNPLSAFFPRKSDGGLNVTTRLLLEEAGGVGTTLAAATAAEVDPAAKQIVQSWRKFYTAWSMDNDSIEQLQKNAVIPAFRLIYESTLRKHGDQLETSLWGSLAGSLTQIPAGGVTGNVFTCGNPEDVFKFGVGDILVFDNAAAGTSPTAGTATVASVQYEAGTVTCDDLSDPAAAAADYVFKSSFQNAGTMSMRDWLPNSVHATTDAFGSTSFDRYPWGARASGWRYTVPAGMSNREAIIRGMSWGKNFGGRAKVLWASPSRVASLVVELQNGVQYDGMSSGELKLNFQGVKLVGPQGPILIIEAPKAPGDRFFALERESWELHTIGELIRNPVHNGKFIDSETEDGIRGRHKTTFALSCHAPGHNGQIIFA
jgi:hypothetical protein